MLLQRERFIRRQLIALALLCLTALASGCAQGSAEAAPPEIRYGEDICAQCSMIINDVRFAAGYAYEVEPGRYASLAFDDIGDMLFHAADHSENNVVEWYVHDFASEEWLDATQATYVYSAQIQTPMGQHTAAYASQEAATAMAAELGGKLLAWPELQARAAAGQLGDMHTMESEHEHGESSTSGD